MSTGNRSVVMGLHEIRDVSPKSRPQPKTSPQRIKMKPRPKVGDRVEFRYRGVLTGKVHAVAETGVHFTIKMPEEHKLKYRLIGLSTIIRILPEIDFKLTPVEYKPEHMCCEKEVIN